MTRSEERTRLRIPVSTGYDGVRPAGRSAPSMACGKSVCGRVASTVLRKVLPLAVSLLLALPTDGDAAALFGANNDNSIQTNKNNMGPLDSYVYSFYPPSSASVVPAAPGANAPIEFAELFRPVKRDSDKRSSDTDIPGVLRFGKRALAPEPLLGNPAGVLRFGKRDDMPGVLRFGKREVPGVLRFGKRVPMGDDMMPGVLRFGKREISGNMPAGVLRFGKKSDDMPGVLRFGRK